MRDRLESADTQEGLADYVECVIKETLRRLGRSNDSETSSFIFYFLFLKVELEIIDQKL